MTRKFDFRTPAIITATSFLLAALAACGGGSVENAESTELLTASQDTEDGSGRRKNRPTTPVPEPTPTPAPAPAPAPAAITQQSYLTADPYQPFSSIDAVNVQVMGTNMSPWYVNESTGVRGNTTDGLTNFAKVADPDDPSKRAFLFQIAKRDPGTSKRTELAWPSSTKGYSVGTTYWQAFRVRLGDNIKNAASSDESIIWQTHDNGATVSMNPNMALIAKGGGANATLNLLLRYSSDPTALREKAVARMAYTSSYPSNKWITFVVQFRPHHTSGNGAFLKMWRDGQLVVNDTQPNDYNVGQENDFSKRTYQKIGLYHYYDDKWTAGESRTMHHKGIVTYVDDGKITEPMVRAVIEAR
jgi:hypothetical protein